MANRYYVGSGGWNSTANWSTSSGGASGASVPGASDTAIFDVHSGDCTTDIAVVVTTLTIGGNGARYNGSFSLGNTLTVNGICTVGGGGASIVYSFATNGYACSFYEFVTKTNAGGGGSATMDFTNSTITLPHTGTIWFFAPSVQTFTGSTILITDTSSTSKTFSSGNVTYNAITITGGGTGAVIFTANDYSWGTFTCAGPKTLNFEASVTNTVSHFNVNGHAGNLVTIISSISGTAATISCQNTVSCTYVSLKDNTSAGASFYYDPNSVIVSNVTGWSAAPGAMVGMLGVLG